jgi:hypothetical protein
MFVWASLDIANNAPTADLNVVCSLGGSAWKKNLSDAEQKKLYLALL